MSHESFDPKIWFLGQKVRLIACGQTDTHESEYRGQPFRVSGIFPSTYHQGSVDITNITSKLTKTIQQSKLITHESCQCVCPCFSQPPKLIVSWNFGSMPTFDQLKSKWNPIFIFTDFEGIFCVFFLILILKLCICSRFPQPSNMATWNFESIKGSKKKVYMFQMKIRLLFKKIHLKNNFFLEGGGDFFYTGRISIEHPNLSHLRTYIIHCLLQHL